jgi:hypothetical protein
VAGPASAAGAASLSAAGFLIDRRPGASFGLIIRDTAFLISLLDVTRFALLLAAVARLVTARHECLLRVIGYEGLNAALNFGFRIWFVRAS